MNRNRGPARGLIAALGLFLTLSTTPPAGAADEPPAGSTSSGIPASLAPFEYLVGSWKGTAVPAANRIRGWPETHAWAWKFAKGTPVGLTLAVSGGKVVKSAQLTYDPASRRYTLAGSGVDGKPISFTGTLDSTGRQLTLDRSGETASGARQRLTLFPNANSIRYTLRVAEQEPGAPQFRNTIEVGLTREGEAFAASGAATELPKCVVTGGAATLTVSYQGKTFPLCCTGCRDEFNDNPEKYVKKAALMAESGRGAPVKKASAGRDDGAFDGLVETPGASSKPAMKGAKPAAEAAAPASKAAEPGKAVDRAARGASLLRLGQNLEKSGKTAAALTYYRQVVRDFPGTPAAAAAELRVKALAPK